jgi:kynurenine formamidase
LSALTELLASIARCRAIDLAQPYFTGVPHYPNPGGSSSAAESIALSTHVGTHIDALCHYSSNGKLHGGEDTAGLQTYANGLERLSVDTIQPIFPRGVLLDIARLQVHSPGRGLEGARWLSERKIFAAGSETAPFELVPNPSMSVHVHVLVESGNHIIECLNLEELSSCGAREFLFVATPLRIRGGTASPIRQIAMVPQEYAPKEHSL